MSRLNGLLVLLLMVPLKLNSQKTESPFQFSIQPPEGINCNPVNTTLILMCGVTHDGGEGSFTVQWFHSTTGGGTTEHLDHNMTYYDHITIAVFEGLTMVTNITEIAGEYWCNVTSSDYTELMSNVLLIDHTTDYSSLTECEDVLVNHKEEAAETFSLISNSNMLIAGFVPVITIETLAIVALILSNISMLILWMRTKQSKDEAFSTKKQDALKKKPKPVPPERSHLSHSDEYESMLMSVSGFRKPQEPDYVLPETFCATPKPKPISKPSEPLTKEVGGHLYAIANPKTREDCMYQDPNT